MFKNIKTGYFINMAARKTRLLKLVRDGNVVQQRTVPSFRRQPEQLEQQDFVEHVASSEQFNSMFRKYKYVCIDFGADWCGPCKMMKPSFKACAQKWKNVKFYYVDVDQHQDLSAKFNISSLPTVVLLINAGNEQRLVGSQSFDSLDKFLAQNVS